MKKFIAVLMFANLLIGCGSDAKPTSNNNNSNNSTLTNTTNVSTNSTETANNSNSITPNITNKTNQTPTNIAIKPSISNSANTKSTANSNANVSKVGNSAENINKKVGSSISGFIDGEYTIVKQTANFPSTIIIKKLQFINSIVVD